MKYLKTYEDIIRDEEPQIGDYVIIDYEFPDKYISKNKEELEIILAANKYNL